MDTAALFRQRLKQLILERYPSLDRFYLESGLSKGHVSEILRGISSPSVTTLIKLAPALVRQAKLGASCRVEVPAEEGLTNHSYRVWQLWRKQ